MKRNTFLIGLVCLLIVILYFLFDPSNSIYFPKCPFKLLTSYDCPGCGSQRALHHLLHFEFAKAFALNALLVLSLPYVVFGLIYQNTSLKEKWPSIQTYLFGKLAIYFWFIVILLWWIVRNF